MADIKFKIVAEDGDARITKFKTRHGWLETPFFMPVATKMAVKHLTTSDLNKIGIQAIISNALVLELSRTGDYIKRRGGIHKLMNFEGSIFTDSGGFQMIRSSFYEKTTENGVVFKDPVNNKKSFLATPESITQLQEKLGSDVAMVLDDHNAHTHTKEKHAHAVMQTYEWGKRCLAAKTDDKQLMFGIIQGGTYFDLRKKSAQLTQSLNFDGIALGGLATGEPIPIMKKVVKTVTKIIDKNKPRYLMGLGSPVEIINTIGMGIDCFDSTYPTQNARHNTLFTHHGKIDIAKERHLHDENPIDQGCNCYTCKNYSRAYVCHLAKSEEPIAHRLKTYHNVYFMNNLMKEAKIAIKENRYKQFEKEFTKNFTRKKPIQSKNVTVI
ncbi:MAG: tRNA guanosine(34) transglycosylase Tgt [Candidatus Woesearchaeota archaeon]|jgi:queuine tRNA-ribosyltransferase